MSKWLMGLGLVIVLTVQGWCGGYYTNITERWFKPPTQIGFSDSSSNLYIGDAAIDPVTGYLLVLDGARYGTSLSTWSTKVDPADTIAIAVLDPESGQMYGRITSIPFVNGWGVSPTRISVTEDGVVLVHGYEGSIIKISSATTLNASNSPLVLGPSTYQPEDPSQPLYGGSMGFSVIGKYKEGRCYIVNHRGNTFFLYKNSPGDIDSFSLIRHGAVAYGTTSNTSDMIQGLEMTNDLRTVYTYRGSNLGVRKFAGEPFEGYVRDTSTNYNFLWEASMDWDPDYNLIAVAGIHNDLGSNPNNDYIRVCFQNLQGETVGSGNESAGVYTRSSTPRVNNELRVGVAIDTTRGNIFAVSNCGIIKFAGSRVTTPPLAQDSAPVILPNPQSASWTEGSLLLNKLIFPSNHYSDISTRIERATLALRQFLQPASPEAGAIPLYLGVIGYDSTVALKCTAEGITVPGKAEAYALSVSTSGITVVGYDLPGLFHGIMTLHQMKQYSSPAILRYGKIEDYPSLSFRGIHTFTGKNALAEQKRLIDMMALWKMNNIVLQIDYMEYKTYPEIYYSPWGQSQADVAEYIQYANDRFIDVAPLVNGPGHFEWAFRTGHHWDLAEDSTPSSGYIPYAYCITYDSTYNFLFNIYDEVVNLFKPKYFHIGHDEVYSTSYSTFPDRSVGYTVRELIEMDFAKVSQYFANKDIDLMFWGDMLLHSSESPGAALAASYADATGMRANLKAIEANAGYPKYNIADWHYGATAPENYGSLTVFKAEGYPTFPSPWYDHDNIRNLALAGIEQGSKGLLQTTWAGFNFSIEANTGNYYQFEAYSLAADYSWSGRRDYIVDLKYSPKTLFWNQWNTLKSNNETVLASDLNDVDYWYLLN